MSSSFSSAAQSLLLSPAELAYLHASLSQHPPIRPDGRSPTQFRPLTAETGFLPGANGSARVCLSDGTEAIVGAKAEIERTILPSRAAQTGFEDEAEDGDEDLKEGQVPDREQQGDDPYVSNDWVELAVEIPGLRDDDAGTVFLASLLVEALLADGHLVRRLYINRRFHWKLYLDILLISPPLSYPLPLLSMTTHLALLATRLPRLKSEADEDPMFDDDWEAATPLYPPLRGGAGGGHRPPVTLLVVAVADNIIFDPSKEELAVADSALAVSVGQVSRPASSSSGSGPGRPRGSKSAIAAEKGPSRQREHELCLLAVRTVDPPARLTPPSVSSALLAAGSVPGAGGAPAADTKPATATTQARPTEGAWQPPRGGTKYAVMAAMMQKVLEEGGVADEVLDGLKGVRIT